MTERDAMHASHAADDAHALDVGDLTPADLVGVTIVDRQGRSVGEVVDVITGPDDRVESIVTEVGGFLGLISHRVALSATQVGVRRGGNGSTSVVLAMSEEELRELPERTIEPTPAVVRGMRS